MRVTTTMDAVIGGMAVFFGVAVGLVGIFFLLGLVTGIFGICATASSEWEELYWKLPKFIIPLIALVSGFAVYKYTQRKSLE